MLWFACVNVHAQMDGVMDKLMEVPILMRVEDEKLKINNPWPYCQSKKHYYIYMYDVCAWLLIQFIPYNNYRQHKDAQEEIQKLKQ